jgi:hypothetical protein
LLALSTFIAGIHLGWRLCLVGAFLGAALVAATYLEEYVWILLIIGLVVLFIVFYGNILPADKSKKMRLLILATAFLSVVVLQTDLSALDDASSLECDGGIVLQGDSEDSVRDKCGNPQKVTREDADSPIIWFYNFGPSEFVYYVSFTDGIVERIQAGGYGD